ncbi:MAG: hypothetical protein NTY19_15975 [Planctomycetota bacterium]|nr:hypothetical protein [Planctomycetota bacterium]
MSIVIEETSESDVFLPTPLAPLESSQAKPIDTPSPILSRLLRMADGYRSSGSPKQAIEMYFELAERNAESLAGRQACDRLVKIAEEYEQQGLARQARSIYERLL